MKNRESFMAKFHRLTLPLPDALAGAAIPRMRWLSGGYNPYRESKDLPIKTNNRVSENENLCL
jgi:hypothetical protein